MIRISQDQVDRLGSPQPCPDIDWIEIELLDARHNPVAGKRYELRSGGKIVRGGTLDGNGFAREENLRAGTYDICFPEIDADLWRRV